MKHNKIFSQSWEWLQKALVVTANSKCVVFERQKNLKISILTAPVGTANHTVWIILSLSGSAALSSFVSGNWKTILFKMFAFRLARFYFSRRLTTLRKLSTKRSSNSEYGILHMKYCSVIRFAFRYFKEWYGTMLQISAGLIGYSPNETIF